ncbi:MAG: STAS domain-containing protein [Lachnospiraceae bacterium]|nr:STAS domain-containing protein [Lachnospiraceae bacterium]MBQ9233965.1 STAS domain-containing protein [Lachnospiraceae bacterium]
MLNIEKKENGKELEIILDGRLDTTTAPDLEKSVKESIEGVENLIYNFEKLEYISSAGLRVLLSSQKIMNKQGSMVVKGSSDEVKEIFEVTGFSDILNIE